MTGCTWKCKNDVPVTQRLAIDEAMKLIRNVRIARHGRNYTLLRCHIAFA
jgi:hypothetical protein